MINTNLMNRLFSDKKTLLIILLILIIKPANAVQPSNYLLKPDGKYAVSLLRYRLINKNICPDVFYRKSDRLFYIHSKNLKHCHLLNLYLFYPTRSQANNYLPYDMDTVLQVQADIKTHKIPIDKQKNAAIYIKTLENIKSYVLPKDPIADSKFPLIIFQPGWSFNSNNYQNFIVNLVSHGYIVAAIDSAYSATISENFGYLYRNKIQYTKEGIPSQEFMDSMLDKKDSSLSIMESDFSFVLNKLSTNSIPLIFNHIDFTKVGGMGHSLGAMSIYNWSLKNGNPLKAFISLDFGQSNDIPKHSYKPNLPSLIFRSAYDKKYGIERHTSNVFNLAKNDYLVLMTPNLDNDEYSKHSSFTDFETLISYADLWRLRENVYGNLNNPWYDSGISYITAKKSLGSANGFEFATTVNQYIVSFFDFELKNKEIPNFKQCKSLMKNSQLYCGPAVIR